MDRVNNTDPTHKIISIRPSDLVFSVNWNLSRRCNYDCMYCPTRLHDDHSPHLSLDQLQKYWIDIERKTSHQGLKYKISFSGGEPTGNRDFLPFLTWLKENYGPQIHKILLTTNGSANYRYYQKLFDLVDNISFSTHSEYIDEQKFFDMVIRLRQTITASKFIHVNIMDEFWNRDRIPYYQKLLTDHDISHIVNEIDYSWQIRNYPIIKGKRNLAIS